MQTPKLLTEMKRRKLTIRKLAIMADVSTEKITWARMGGRVSQPIAIRLATALDMKPETLFPNFATLRTW